MQTKCYPWFTAFRLGLAAGLLVLVVGLQACSAVASNQEGNPPSSGEEPSVQTTLSGPDADPLPAATPVPPAVPEHRMITLEWPASLRAGDSHEVRLTLEVDAHGNLIPTAEVAGHKVSGEVVEIPNLYETHHVFAEARLDMAGIEVRPDGLISTPLLQGQSVSFYWSISAREANTYRGRVWLYLHFKDKLSGEESQRVIYNHPLDIQAVDLFGLSGRPARWLGGAGALLGSVISLDSLVAWLWKRLKGQRRWPAKARS